MYDPFPSPRYTYFTFVSSLGQFIFYRNGSTYFQFDFTKHNYFEIHLFFFFCQIVGIYFYKLRWELGSGSHPY